MARSLLINEADLTAFTDIGVGYNSNDLKNAVLKAQDRPLQDIIGKALLKRFEGDIASSTALPADYTTLLNDYISPFLIQASYLEVLEQIYLKPRSNGLGQRNSSPDFTTVSREAFGIKKSAVKSDMDYYGDKLVEYLESNSNNFSELYDNDLTSDNANLDNQRSNNPFIFSKRSRNDYKLYEDGRQ